MSPNTVREDYAKWVAKFSDLPKTNDDTFTPPNVYLAVAGWVARRYGVDAARFVRPFWPGGDYQAHGYGPDDIVVDNPPFSIVARIVAWYQTAGIKFFLFAPYQTNIGIGRGTGVGHVLAPCTILYANGARVNTSFVTNLDPGTVAESAPDLVDALKAANDENERARRGGKQLPKYVYPPEVLTSTGLGRLAVHGVPFRVAAGECAFVSALDAQRPAGKSCFGGALLLSPRAAAERAVSQWRLSDRERAISAGLVGNAIQWCLSDRERAISAGLASSHNP